MERLKQISISSVDSVGFSENFGDLDSLEYLEISWVRKAMKFPEYLGVSVKGLKTSQCGFDKLPKFKIGSSLENLSLTGIKNMDDRLELSNTENLRFLKISSPRGGALRNMVQYPENLNDCAALNHLEILNSGITFLSDQLNELSSLRNLIISGAYFDKEEYLKIFGPVYDYLQYFNVELNPDDINDEVFLEKIKEVNEDRKKRTEALLTEAVPMDHYMNKFKIYSNRIKYWVCK